jgi:hypothetical protein
MLTSERLALNTERALMVCAIFDADRQIGLIEYVGIARRGGGTTYGWRPLHSGWQASKLRTKREAATALVKKGNAA